MKAYGFLDQKGRQAAKEASRRADAEALRLGQVSVSDLARRNGFFSSVDLSSARIVAVGPRKCSVPRQQKL